MPDLLIGSYLVRILDAIRRSVDEPSINAKYDDNDIIALLKEAWAEIWVELNNNSNSPIYTRYDITIVEDQQNYALPPLVGQVVRLGKVNATTDLIEWDVDVRSVYNPAGYGVRIEGNTLRLARKWKDGETLRLTYVPSGEICPITAQFSGGTAFTDNTVTLPSTTTLGVLDSRPNAYAGYLIRTVPASGTTPTAGELQTITNERLITAYDAVTRVATVAVDWDPQDASIGTTLNFEIVPSLLTLCEAVIKLRTAQNMLAMEGNSERYRMQDQEYKRKIRNLRLYAASNIGRRANQFEGDILENRKYRFPFPFTSHGGP